MSFMPLPDQKAEAIPNYEINETQQEFEWENIITQPKDDHGNDRPSSRKSGIQS